MRFLIDECLTVELVGVAADAGFEAYHVARVGKAGWKGMDFRPLYADQLLHPGLVILIPNVATDIQKRLFKGAMDELTRYGEPVNHVLEVNLDGEDMIFDLYALPP